MNILFIGLPGVPFLGRACDPRLASIANILNERMSVSILNRYSSLRQNKVSGISLSDGIITREIIARKNTGVLWSKILYVFSVIKEPFVVLSINKKDKIDFIHLYSGHYLDFVVSHILGRLIGAKVVYEYVEYRSGKSQKGLYHKVNSFLCDKIGAKLWDICIAISDYLIASATRINPTLPIIKVTPICDYQLFETNRKNVDISREYIMFCGHAGYFDTVKLVIDSFFSSTICAERDLLLVLGGSDSQVERIKEYNKKCIIKQRIPYELLVAYYKHAYALMIPIHDSQEDIARFPNKICEYAAAHGLIVTTNYGEIKNYFKDGENAVIAGECSVEAISSCLDKVNNGSYDVERIKENCFKTGMKCFSIESYKEKLFGFLQTNK